MSATRQSVRAFARPFARAVRDYVLPHTLPTLRADRVTVGDRNSARVIGLLSSATGLGNSARLCARDLHKAGLQVTAHDVSPLFGRCDNINFAAQCRSDQHEAVAIYHLNPPMLLPGIISSGLRDYYRTLNVGYWAWELESLPAHWISNLSYVDAVFTPSTFCRDAIARVTEKPVFVVPHPVRLQAPREIKSNGGTFTVLSSRLSVTIREQS
jgi:hypothetical protein